MKIFEANIGGQWMSWKSDDSTKFKKIGRILKMTSEAKAATAESPGHDRLETIFNLDLIPAYTIG